MKTVIVNNITAQSALSTICFRPFARLQLRSVGSVLSGLLPNYTDSPVSFNQSGGRSLYSEEQKKKKMYFEQNQIRQCLIAAFMSCALMPLLQAGFILQIRQCAFNADLHFLTPPAVFCCHSTKSAQCSFLLSRNYTRQKKC